MTRVGILGIDPGHRHILHAMCELFSVDEVELTVCTTEDNFENLRVRGCETKNLKTLLKPSNESTRSFLDRVEEFATADLDLLYINTVGYSLGRYLSYVGFDPDCQLYARIFNSRTWFNPTLEIRNLRSFGYVNLCHVPRQLFRRKLDGVVVEYPPMKQFIKTETTYSGSVSTIPILFDTAQYESAPSPGDIHVVVPGNVQSHRRDYDSLLDAFEQTDGRVSLELLGRPRDEYGEHIITRCRELRREGYEVVTHSNWIDDTDFERGIASADIICSPFRSEVTASSLNTEIYGRTKGSAIIGHALRHSKPLLVPDWFELSWLLPECSLTYSDNEELAELFGQIEQDEVDVGKLNRIAKTNTQRIGKFYSNHIRSFFAGDLP
ncbi:hypothetical protein [Natrinema salsiterrestre]|uniref:Glycosyltransferase n=1 Tax=Natrinema salsiterrestre TaxID=2950540 RepID=A0A9Q4Q336_9EURY|nr:hypothetical protein [Natrinema salsiterrestre]MDF9745863.1 hypothetical protein [Natrinema salsiterrestre]